MLTVIAHAWHGFNSLLALGIFFAYLAIDALYAKYTLSVTRHQASLAAMLSVIIYLLLAFGVVSYIQNFLYLVPLGAGAWIGTYLVVWQERKQANV